MVNKLLDWRDDFKSRDYRGKRFICLTKGRAFLPTHAKGGFILSEIGGNNALTAKSLDYPQRTPQLENTAAISIQTSLQHALHAPPSKRGSISYSCAPGSAAPGVSMRAISRNPPSSYRGQPNSSKKNPPHLPSTPSVGNCKPT
ncbi:hypothetical protein BD779DRAFT_1499055 [Infundibulicybe gibba]|nr:hypothetical protein BD779DRAFT_1499055 [Infundibulicybe gibba]